MAEDEKSKDSNEKKGNVTNSENVELKQYKINEIELGMKGIILDCEIDFMEDYKKITRSYGDPLYARAYLKDETGEIKVTFWEDDVLKAKPGMLVHIENASTTEFRGELQLNLSKESTVVLKKKTVDRSAFFAKFAKK